MPDRSALLESVIAESRQHYAAWTLFNQAMADRLGLHPTDLQCLGLLDLQPEPLGTGEIAKLTGLTPGSATRLVDRLEKAGMVVRAADPDDRRRALVALAPGSLAGVEQAWEGPGRAFGEVLERYTDDELTVIGDYLRRVSAVGREQAALLARER
ncbi:MarR family winged helix-turn-helix transcriptional regulator [Wenjunlia tyrosinilytica]|jgi:DNA-binding MarR family transcriptional regulator|uniref:MarR family transcriptional regulator n=1 Tax=Wenjunlia tyrosinilytica TaxID=1544741 RepID=A0A918DZ85_9ACTN|nr:MarR family transcriptional regulator [Wenjunlia tyrosinilytica]GGO89408.1 MarR family transcriptional regulator [Wenjunlia tyrosinilytica]